MKITSPSIYVCINDHCSTEETAQPAQLATVTDHKRLTISNVSSNGSALDSCTFSNFDRSFLNMAPACLIEQTDIDGSLKNLFLHGYNMTIALVQNNACLNDECAVDVILSKIGGALLTVEKEHSVEQQQNTFLEYCFGTFGGSSEETSVQFECIENWDMFVDELKLTKTKSLLNDASFLSFRYHLQDEFVSVLNLVVIPELCTTNSSFLNDIKNIIDDQSIPFNPLAKLLFCNVHLTMLVSTNLNDINEGTFSTVDLLKLLDALKQLKSVLTPNTTKSSLNQAHRLCGLIGEDSVILQDYQNASLKVVEALEMELNKLNLVKTSISKELSTLRHDFVNYQKDTESRYSLFEKEEITKMETESLLYKTSLESLLEQIGDTQNELRSLSHTYQQDLNRFQKELIALNNSLIQNQKLLSNSNEQISTLENEIQTVKNEKAILSTQLLEAQSKLLSTESNYESQVGTLQKANSTLQQSLTRAESERKATTEELQERDEALRMEITQLQAKLDKSMECNKATQSTIRSLNRDKAELSSKVDDLQEKCIFYEEEQTRLSQQIQELKKRKDSSRSISITRLESQLEDERKSNFETSSKLESLQFSIQEQIREAVNKERIAVKNERVEMQNILKESQERILELESILQQFKTSEQPNPPKKNRSIHSKAKAQSNNVESDEENVPNTSASTSSKAHLEDFNFGNDRLGNSSINPKTMPSKAQRNTANSRSQIPIHSMEQTAFSDKSKQSSLKSTFPVNSSASVAPSSPRKISAFVPKSSITSSFGAARKSEHSNVSSSSILSGVSFDTSFVDAVKRTRLTNIVPSATSSISNHQRSLRSHQPVPQQQPSPSNQSVMPLGHFSGTVSGKRSVPNDILNDFKIPAAVSK